VKGLLRLLQRFKDQLARRGNSGRGADDGRGRARRRRRGLVLRGRVVRGRRPVHLWAWATTRVLGVARERGQGNGVNAKKEPLGIVAEPVRCGRAGTAPCSVLGPGHSARPTGGSLVSFSISIACDPCVTHSVLDRDRALRSPLSFNFKLTNEVATCNTGDGVGVHGVGGWMEWCYLYRTTAGSDDILQSLKSQIQKRIHRTGNCARPCTHRKDGGPQKAAAGADPLLARVDRQRAFFARSDQPSSRVALGSAIPKPPSSHPV